ncbi:MAG: acyltransferase [Hyphomonadaceae bacterium]
MTKPSKIERALLFSFIRLSALLGAHTASNAMIFAFRRWGMKFDGTPRYLSWRTNFDGTDYGLIEIGEGTTVSSFCRILTHDWAADTIARGMDMHFTPPLGRVAGVKIGKFSFIGTNSVVMPGAKVGNFCIVGAGSVVRGTIPDYAIYTGSPGKIVGDTRDLVKRVTDARTA